MNKTTTIKQGNNENKVSVENKARFQNLLRAYEVATQQGDNEKQLIELSTVIAYSVIKKCLDVSQNPQLRSVKNDITKDNAHFKALENVNNNTFSLGYNTDGDIIQIVHDKALQQAFDKLVQQCLGDGLDLVNTAIVGLLEETEKQRNRENGLNATEWLEIPYTVRQLKRKVYIKLEESVKGWEDVEVTPIQQIYRKVRKEIENSRAMSTDARNGYSYLEEYATDEESDTTARIYKRLPKYADLGGHATDYNGKNTFYTIDKQSVENVETIIDKLNLTVKQSKVLELRMRGYGYKAIATYCGVTQRAIAKTLEQIQKKALEIGLNAK